LENHITKMDQVFYGLSINEYCEKNIAITLTQTIKWLVVTLWMVFSSVIL
jgi:hypothetical protein